MDSTDLKWLDHGVTVFDHYGNPFEVLAAGPRGALLQDTNADPFRPGSASTMRLGGNEHFLLTEVVSTSLLPANQLLVQWVDFAGTSVPATVGFMQRAFGVTLHPSRVTLTGRRAETAAARAEQKSPEVVDRQTLPWGVLTAAPRTPRITGSHRAASTPPTHRRRRTPSAPIQRPRLPSQPDPSAPKREVRIRTTPPSRAGWRSTPPPEGH